MRATAIAFLIAALAASIGCGTTGEMPGGSYPPAATAGSAVATGADDLIIVDCLLPGKVKKLGRMTYLTARRPVKTTAADCEIRGGEYTAYDRGSYVTALNVWLPAAREGDKVAQTYVGEIYMKGIGGPPQYDMAAQWFRKAADQGYGRAQMNLGYLYEMGMGISRDPVEALNLYRAAAGLEEELALGSEGAGAAEKEELERLRLEVDSLREETRTLRRRLEESRRERDSGRQTYELQMKKLEAGRKELAKTEKELARLRSELAREKGPGTDRRAADQAEIEKLKRQLAEREAQLERGRSRTMELEREIADLDARARSYERRLEQSEKASVLREKLEKQQDETRRISEKLGLALEKEKEFRQSQQSNLQQLSERQKALDETRKKLEAAEKESDLSRNREIDRLEKELALRQAALEEEREKAGRVSAELAAVTAEAENHRKRLEELERLQARLDAEAEENEKLRRVLETTRRQKAELAEEFEWKQKQLEAERQGLRKAREAMEAGMGEELSQRQARLAELEAEAAARRDEIEKRRSETEFLRARAEQLAATAAEYEKKLESYEKKIENLSGPSIEILDPTLAVTRGENLVARANPNLEKLRVVGKVTAPAGIYSLKINDREEKWNEEGMFKVDVGVEKKETPVRITAIDSRGKVQQMVFILRPGDNGQGRDDSTKVDFGRYHALIIGNNDYEHFPRLQTAANDARAVEKLLREKYGFETKLLVDARRFEIYTELDRYRSTLTEEDNFLLYYAGHGELDEKNRRGYWLPVDAVDGSHVNSIPNYTVTDILNAMSVRQAIVIADTCYSGSLTRSAISKQTAGMTREKRLAWLKKLAEKRSRTVLSSGGLNPILDAGKGEHSVFARALLDKLIVNEDILEAGRLYSELRGEVIQASRSLGLEQTPQYAANIHAGHEAGDFLFVPGKYQKNMASVYRIRFDGRADGPVFRSMAAF